MRADSHTASPLESTKPEVRNLDAAPSSKGDLVDEMRRMEGEGRIDMSAFAGEPNPDDEEGTYGGEPTDDADDDWLTADGETLSEEEAERLLDAESYEELEQTLDADAEDGDADDEEE